MVDKDEPSLAATLGNMISSRAGAAAAVDKGTDVHTPVAGLLTNLVTAAVIILLALDLGAANS